MPTNRKPRRHGPRSNRFTPDVLEAFRVMENAESEHSEEWEAADRYIRRALKLPPWHWPSARAGEPGSDALPAKLHAELTRASDD